MSTYPPVTKDQLHSILNSIGTEVGLVGHFSSEYHRSIEFDWSEGIYKVYDHGKVIASVPLAEQAADAYNAIRPRTD